MYSEDQDALRQILCAYVRKRGAVVGNQTAIREIRDELHQIGLTGVHGARHAQVNGAEHRAVNGQFGR